MICIPTNSGTAAEITDVDVLSDPDKKVKPGLFSPYIAPAEKAVQAVVQLSEDIGLPKDLSVYGVKEEGLEKVSKTVAANFQNALSPRKASSEEIQEISRAAL